jgi:hypothetical protein
MVKFILIMASFAIFMLSFSLALGKIAESAANKSLVFAEDINNAVDCAVRAVPIEECSPRLMDETFQPNNGNYTRITQNVTMTYYYTELEDLGELMQQFNTTEGQTKTEIENNFLNNTSDNNSNIIVTFN